MPVKTNTRKAHHVAHKKEKRTKSFLKAYAPFIPLLLIISAGIALASHGDFPRSGSGKVQSYATGMSDDDLLKETNKYRESVGVTPLTFNSQLDQAAQAKAEDMAAKNYWSHNTPDGREPWVFVEAAGYQYQKSAENLAYGFRTSEATLSGWMNSPHHRATVIDKGLEQVGFGFVNVPNYQDKGPQTIVVAMYGSPITSSTGLAASPSSVLPATESRSISIVQSLTAGKAPWSSFAVGLVIGSIVMYLTVTHARGLRRAVAAGESFIVHHPMLDITLVALLGLAFIAGQSIGTIY